MKTNNCGPLMACVTAILVIAVVLPLQSATAKSSGSGTSATRWSVQVDQVDPGTLDLSYSFQVAIYENLLDELKKTKQFQQVFRDGDHKASEVPNLLVLKTTVEKYTSWQRNAACGDHREWRHEVNSAESTPYTRRQSRSGANRERRSPLLRQQYAGYSQPGPKYRQGDQTVILARGRSASSHTYRPALSREYAICTVL